MSPAAVGVALVLAVTAAMAFHDHGGHCDWRGSKRSQLAAWLFAAGVAAYVTFVEGRPLASLDPDAHLSVDPGSVAVGWMLAAGTGIAAGLSMRLLGRQQFDPVFETLVSQPLHRVLFVAIGAGVTEEVVYRGFLVTRVTSLTGSEWVAVAIGGVAFGAMHAATRSRTRLVQLTALGAPSAPHSSSPRASSPSSPTPRTTRS